MKRAISCLLASAALAGAAPAAAQVEEAPPQSEASPGVGQEEASDPTEVHRWHMPRRGARSLYRDVAGPVHAEWNRFGHVANSGKSKLKDWGITFDVDLNFFDQYASRVISGQQNFATFSWRVMGDWKLFDLDDGKRLSVLGKGYIGWTTFGSVGLGYDTQVQTLTGNVGSISGLNSTVFESGGVVDELFWKQVAWGGKLLLLGGKIDQLYHFDTNRVANDAYSQFFSYALQNNPSIPGPLFGGFGALVRGNLSDDIYLMFGVGDSSVNENVAPWETLSNDSWYQLLELGVTHPLPKLGKGTYRLTPWHNHLFGADGFGVAFNFDQELGCDDLVAFFRFGWGEEDVTPVKTFVSGGVALASPFGRKGDRVAVGVAWSDPSPGNGGRAETLLELQYRIEIAKAISITPDLQLVFDPADNPDADLSVVPGVRVLMKF